MVSLEKKKKKVLRKIPLKQIQGVLAMKNRWGGRSAIGERWKCRSAEVSVSREGRLGENISLSLFFCDGCATICIHHSTPHLRLYRRGGSVLIQWCFALLLSTLCSVLVTQKNRAGARVLWQRTSLPYTAPRCFLCYLGANKKGNRKRKKFVILLFKGIHRLGHLLHAT